MPGAGWHGGHCQLQTKHLPRPIRLTFLDSNLKTLRQVKQTLDRGLFGAEAQPTWQSFVKVCHRQDFSARKPLQQDCQRFFVVTERQRRLAAAGLCARAAGLPGHGKSQKTKKIPKQKQKIPKKNRIPCLFACLAGWLSVSF